MKREGGIIYPMRYKRSGEGEKRKTRKDVIQEKS
jgi:hypothetical protein